MATVTRANVARRARGVTTGNAGDARGVVNGTRVVEDESFSQRVMTTRDGDAMAVVAPTRDGRGRTVRRESARAFVARRREMFLVQMDVENKTREMARLEARAERDVRHREEKLSECQKYKEFLDALTPKEWFDERGEDASEMYYREPEQLLAAFSALEEQNLFLIQNVSDAEETLERVKSEHAREKARVDAEIVDLREQTRRLREAIEAEEREGEKLTHHLANERGDTLKSRELRGTKSAFSSHKFIAISCRPNHNGLQQPDRVD